MSSKFKKINYLSWIYKNINVDEFKIILNILERNVGNDVFLGGSCNPTTWRKDEAIPLLDSLGISYFNPVSSFINTLRFYL